MPKERSSAVSTLPSKTGAKKLGHPVPESNFASEEKRGRPQPTQR